MTIGFRGFVHNFFAHTIILSKFWVGCVVKYKIVVCAFCLLQYGIISKLSKRGGRAYLIFVVFFTRTKFLENKIYTEKTRKLRQNTQKIANFLRYYGKIHSKLPIFCVKSVKIYSRDKYQVWAKSGSEKDN